MRCMILHDTLQFDPRNSTVNSLQQSLPVQYVKKIKAVNFITSSVNTYVPHIRIDHLNRVSVKVMMFITTMSKEDLYVLGANAKYAAGKGKDSNS